MGDPSQGALLTGAAVKLGSEARQRLGVGDELADPGAMEGGGERDLDAELVRAMGLAVADAFDLGRVQRIDLIYRADAGAARARGGRA